LNKKAHRYQRVYKGFTKEGGYQERPTLVFVKRTCTAEEVKVALGVYHSVRSFRQA